MALKISRCGSCKRFVDFSDPPAVRWNEPGNDKWLCIDCDSEVCVGCYVDHTWTVHGNVHRAHSEMNPQT